MTKRGPVTSCSGQLAHVGMCTQTHIHAYPTNIYPTAHAHTHTISDFKNLDIFISRLGHLNRTCDWHIISKMIKISGPKINGFGVENFLFYVLSNWNLFFKYIPSCPKDIYRPNFLASLALMISLSVLGLYKWLLYTSQDDSLFTTRRITSFNVVLS